MPASRSRTERWRECLRQVHERDGALEISIPAEPGGAAPGPEGPARGDLIWRVRIVALDESSITIEQPSAAGRFMDLQPGLELVAVMAIGQNRWMFHTRITGAQGTGPTRSLRLVMPTTVERCQRRHFYRISTAELCLPRVECWPLLDPTSVIPAEIANRAHILSILESGDAIADRPRALQPAARITSVAPGSSSASDEPLLLPEVGPMFTARLMNLGGGGVGLIIDPRESGAADRARLLWLRIDLTPRIPAPIAMTARPVHTHLDSAQNLYYGLAFEWSFHPAHREFVVEQIGRYVSALQLAQRRFSASA
ncbi:MAG: flagellar brake domain-containing protein [Phycisphaerales bacterium]